MGNQTEQLTVDFEPLGRRARVPSGTSLLEAARQAGVGLNAVCGGSGTCGMCRVRVLSGQVSPPTDTEDEAVAEGLRLACRSRVLSDVKVHIPPTSMTAQQRAQVEGRERVVEFHPGVRAFDVTVDAPSRSDLRSDTLRLRDALCQQHGVLADRFDPIAWRQISALIRADDWRLRAVLRNGEVIAAVPSGTAPLGLAVDIGTTKLAGYLVNLDSGETMAAAGRMNPQIAYGEDVMARIAYAIQGAPQAKVLHEVLIEGLDSLAHDLCAAVGRECSEVVEAVLVGNTCMHHLVLDLPVRQLGLAPYVATLDDACDVKARDLGLHIAPGANVHLLPNIAGFVGADHVSMVLGSGLEQASQITVGLDIGTNTEISLAADGRLLCCSCASGPAFEGAHIHDGMRAAPGAVEWIRATGDAGDADLQLNYQTIDDAPPVGICGSGILDGVAELRRIGIVRPNGAMRVKEGAHPRLRDAGNGAEFLLVPAGERGAPRDIVITRRDVNEVQLAKAAIRAGIEVLLSEASLTAAQVERVVVAGAFGTYLDVGSALAVGMFPSVPRERFAQVGNAAGMGAKMVLVSSRCRKTAQEVARRMNYIELTTHPRFVQIYAEALMLP